MGKHRENIEVNMLPTAEFPPVHWKVLPGLTDYETSLAQMEVLAKDIHLGISSETVLLVEHPALYTAGTSADKNDLVEPDRLPVFETGRGGEYTYHGPGQRVAYVMLDLTKRRQDVRAYVAALEQWIIRTLDQFNIVGERREDRVGVWVKRPAKKSPIQGAICEDKIAAIGIRIKKWITLHGISINVEPALENYQGIVPCGIAEHGVTSLVDLGLLVTMEDLDLALKQEFEPIFGSVTRT